MPLRLLPNHSIHSACYSNLDDLARERFPLEDSPTENRLLDPSTCQKMIDQMHAERGCAWSYGGYLEDRSHLWRLSYMEETGECIHLGVDCNVPAGSPVAAPYDCTVMHLFDDGDTPQGWGPRITVAPLDPALPYLILAHLKPLSLHVGEKIVRGAVISEVAAPPFNGRWFPHLHIQQVARAFFHSLSADEVNNIDGYGHRSGLKALQERYPDPSFLLRVT